MDLEKQAIERIKIASEMSLHHYGQPLVCTYSGGKDSDVLMELFKRSGVPFEVHHSHTTVDAPPTVYHIRDKFRSLEEHGVKCTIQMPTYKSKSVTMWSLIPQKRMPPTRTARYCCSKLKETGCANRFIATGVRWAESKARSERQAFETFTVKKKDSTKISDEIMLLSDNEEKRKLIEHCKLKSKSVVNPIIDWLDRDVWGYASAEHITLNPMYQIGYYRVGCIGCPMAGKGRWKGFSDFPTYERAYIRAFDKMLEVNRKADPTKTPSWKNGQDVFRWWMEDKNIEGQYSMVLDDHNEFSNFKER